jgi:hypothetical protein
MPGNKAVRSRAPAPRQTARNIFGNRKLTRFRGIRESAEPAGSVEKLWMNGRKTVDDMTGKNISEPISP